jgi:hypothetical protein
MPSGTVYPLITTRAHPGPVDEVREISKQVARALTPEQSHSVGEQARP